MNKRNFFKTLALLAGTAAIAPNVFLPKLESFHWKRSQSLWVINPDWVSAPFEVTYVYAPHITTHLTFENIVVHKRDGVTFFTEQIVPSRFAMSDDGQLVLVPPYKQLETTT